jgi:hypothetical protein
MNYITISILIALGVITLIYLLRRKIVVLTDLFLKFGYPILAIVLLIFLFLPNQITSLVDMGLKQTDLYISIVDFDHQLQSAGDLPQTAVDSFFNLIDKNGKLFPNRTMADKKQPEVGLLESKLYPVILNSCVFLIRTVVIVLSLAGLIMIVYMSFSVESISEVERLKARVAHLEAKLA